MPAIAAPVLTEFATKLLVAVGVPRDDAAVVASSLVGANLRGHDSHGVMRLLQYVGFIERGEVRIGVALQVENETPALVVCDGQWGLGQVQAHRLLDLVVPKAHGAGSCGRGGAKLRAHRSLGRIRRTGGGAGTDDDGDGQQLRRLVAGRPAGGIEPRLATNPFCAAVPTASLEAPIVVDFATSVVAEGKVRGYYISGRPVPEGWLLDHKGQPTTDPAVLYEPPLGTILPLGGAQSYKGFGLGLILELWAGGLSGGRCSQPDAPPPGGNNVVFLVLDPARFAGCESVFGQATQLAEYIRATPRARGVDAIVLPGDPERNVLAPVHPRHPLDVNHWTKLAELATD